MQTDVSFREILRRCLRMTSLLAFLLLYAAPLFAETTDTQSSMRVLQNRYFLKSYRPSLGVFAGTFINESYVATRTSGLRVNLFFNEWFGMGLQTMRTKVENSRDRKNLETMSYRATDSEKIVHPDPEVNAIHSSMDVDMMFVPFYGKIDLLDMAIIYMDFYALTGFSKLETDQGELNAFNLGLGQIFYIKKNFALRFDFRQRSHYEMQLGEKQRKDTQSFDLGIHYHFF